MQQLPFPKVGTYDFEAETFHCDFTDHLFIGHLGNAMLNAADFHSNERGYGMHYLQTINRTWVLSRLVIELEEMPQAYDKFQVSTWVEGVMRFFTSRDFAVRSRDGQKVYGYGRSIWAMIDTSTRQPVDILKVREGIIQDYVDAETLCPIPRAGRIKMREDLPKAHALEARYSDVDVNGHVNSVKYVEHALDLFPMAWYQEHRIQRIEIAYVAESHAGDQLNLYKEEQEEGVFNIKLTKGKQEETEVVRISVKFVKI